MLATCGDYNLPMHFGDVFNEFLGDPALAMVAIHFIGREGVDSSTCGIQKLVAPTGLWLQLDCVSQLHSHRNLSM